MIQKQVKKKPLRKVPKRRTSAEQAYNDFTAVLENVYAEIDAMGETQELMQEKMEKGFRQQQEAIEKLDHRLTTLEVKVSEEMAYIKHEIRLIRHDLTQKINRAEFEALEERVTHLEKELAVR